MRKANLKKLVSMLCVMAMLVSISASGIVFRDADSRVYAADGNIAYEHVTLEDFGMAETVTSCNNSLLDDKSTQETHWKVAGRSLDQTEVQFVLNIENKANHFMWMELGAARTAVTTIENAPAASVVLYVTPAGRVNVSRFGIGVGGITEEEMTAAGLNFAGNDVEIKTAFTFETPETETTNVLLRITCTDLSNQKTITKNLTLGEYKQTDMQCELGGYFSYYGNGTLKSTKKISDYKKISTVDFGMAETVTSCNNSLLDDKSTQETHWKVAGRSLDQTEVQFVLNIENKANHFMWMELGAARTAVTTIENAPAASVVLYVTPAGRVNVSRFGIGVGGITEEEMTAAGLNFAGNDVEIKTAFTFETPETETTNVLLRITCTDLSNQKTMMKNLTLGEYKQADMQCELGGYFSYYGNGTLKVATIGPVIGGGNTGSAELDLRLSTGDTLPIGYTADGKYILSWTLNGTAADTYDASETGYEAKFVDTKMLKVGKQYKVEEDGTKTVRFIATLDTLEGYTEAGFIFANKTMDEELTLMNGSVAHLNTAYAALNADGVSVTPVQSGVYDAYSKYFIAYAIRKIPTNVTIYARAYVIIDGVTIYGDMGTFVIDELK